MVSAITDLTPWQAHHVTGTTVRIGPDQVVTEDLDIHKAMTAPRSPWRRGRWFRGMKFDPRMDNLLSMSDEKAHAALRAKLMPGVSIQTIWASALAHLFSIQARKCHCLNKTLMYTSTSLSSS
jgi:hypothetical protein